MVTLRILARGGQQRCSSVVEQSVINTILSQHAPKSVLDTSCNFPRLCALNDYCWRTAACVKACPSRGEMDHIHELRRSGRKANFTLCHPAPTISCEPLNLSSREVEDMMSYGERFDMVLADRLPSPDFLSLATLTGRWSFLSQFFVARTRTLWSKTTCLTSTRASKRTTSKMPHKKTVTRFVASALSRYKRRRKALEKRQQREEKSQLL
jgi:hypothetical protein